MELKEWRNRYKNRNDISSRLTHLTKGEDTNGAFENLLYERQLRKETQCKVRYMAFGVRFNKAFIYRRGGRPVIYEKGKR